MADANDKHAHFRVSSNLVERVNEASSKKGLSASSYMRMAILERLEKDEA